VTEVLKALDKKRNKILLQLRTGLNKQLLAGRYNTPLSEVPSHQKVKSSERVLLHKLDGIKWKRRKIRILK